MSQAVQEAPRAKRATRLREHPRRLDGHAIVDMVLARAGLDRSALDRGALDRLVDQCRDAKERLNPSSRMPTTIRCR